MKRFILTIAVVLFALSAYAQDLTFGEAFNKANELYQAGKKVEAIAQYKVALNLATEAGEEGEEVVMQCKDYIPQILKQVAKEKVDNKEFDEALALYQDLKEIGTSWSNNELVEQAKSSICQIDMIKGDNALNNQQFDEAIAQYKKVLEQDEKNANAHIRIGMAENAKGNVDAAVEYIKKAKELGAQNADDQLSNIYMKQLSVALNGKNYAAALAAAEKVNEIAENPQASMYGGIAAYNLKNYNKAIALLKKAQPSANVNYYLAQSYDKAGNKAQACAYYKKLVNDAKFGSFAKQKVATCK